MNKAKSSPRKAKRISPEETVLVIRKIATDAKRVKKKTPRKAEIANVTDWEAVTSSFAVFKKAWTLRRSRSATFIFIRFPKDFAQRS